MGKTEPTNFEKGILPVIDGNARILILGSFPGVKSLDASDEGRYYDNPYNQFWKIMQKNNEIPASLLYKERIALLKKHHIGLWDVLSSCKRIGSRDNTIKDPQYNDIFSLIKKYPNIRIIILNGTSGTRKNMKKYCKNLKQSGNSFPDTVKIRCAPSTSPQNWTNIEEKCKLWKQAMDLSS
jgi:hypoxanthine-DNA glycosylase